MPRTRITPLEPPYDPPIERTLSKWMPPDSAIEPLRLFRTLAVHQSLFGRMLPLGAGILGHGLLEPRLRELLILRTCARCGAEYEWGVHATFFGNSVGLSPAEIEATVVAGPEDPLWSERERSVIQLADELHESAGASDETYAELERHFSPPQILELAIAAGWYHTISFVINTAGVEREPWAARLPSTG
jgi:alkylhydroperoxidase family enzyme